MEKKIVVIGAGIAGLAAGCYARMNGYQVELYESHKVPGGLCTSWNRKGYKIDGCLHWLTGSAPADSFYRLWKELGAIQGRKIHDPEIFYRFRDREGRTFNAYCDADRLENHMKEISPADSESIEFLCRMIRKFSRFRSPVDKAFELFNVLDIVKMIWTMRPYMKSIKACSGITAAEFAERFKDPLLREALKMLLNDRDISLFAIIVTLSLLHNRAGGYPEGGSLEFARAIEKRLVDLGGRIHYGKQVERILVQDQRATGIRLEDGTEIDADYVISCADLYSTIHNLLGGKFIEPQHAELFRTSKIFNSSIQVSFGVRMDLTHEPLRIGDHLELHEPIQIGEKMTEWILVRNYAFDPTTASAGKTVIICIIPEADYDYWEKLYREKKAYKAEKERIASMIADKMNQIYPGFCDALEVTDVATPMTYVRYTGNYRGAYMTWVMTPELMKQHRLVKKSINGLDNFWLSGMWVQPPGGVPTGAKTSRDIMQMICKKDRRRFVTSVPPVES